MENLLGEEGKQKNKEEIGWKKEGGKGINDGKKGEEGKREIKRGKEGK
jgi:hypothetical protein